MDRRSFAKTALGALAGGVVASTAEAKASAPKASNRIDLNAEVANDLADEQIRAIQMKRGYRHQGKKGANGKHPLEGKCTSFLLFADVHLVTKHLQVIRDFYNAHKKYIDDTIHLGDTVGAYYPGSFDMWKEFPNALNVIGNHDVYSLKAGSKTDYWKENSWLTDVEKFETYFKPYISTWNAVFPPNAEAEGKCYWYKDYNNHIRVIGIDCMRSKDPKQHEWFSSTLEDALAKKLKIVVATHVSPTVEAKDTVLCNFTSLDYPSTGNNLGNDFLPMLDAFIDAGGEFVSWICGHDHHDIIGYASKAKNKQLVVILECATDFNWWTDANHVRDTETAGCWTLFAIESITNVIKLTRFGNNYDHYLRHKGTLCYDYKNHKIISQY